MHSALAVDEWASGDRELDGKRQAGYPFDAALPLVI